MTTPTTYTTCECTFSSFTCYLEENSDTLPGNIRTCSKRDIIFQQFPLFDFTFHLTWVCVDACYWKPIKYAHLASTIVKEEHASKLDDQTFEACLRYGLNLVPRIIQSADQMNDHHLSFIAMLGLFNFVINNSDKIKALPQHDTLVVTIFNKFEQFFSESPSSERSHNGGAFYEAERLLNHVNIDLESTIQCFRQILKTWK